MDCSGDCSSCPHRASCASGEIPDSVSTALDDVRDSLSGIRHKLLVLSGKGGVGKSTVAYLISKHLSATHCVGVLDADLCGPSLPVLFGAPPGPLFQSALGIQPHSVSDTLSLVSTQFFLPSADSAVAARGPLKTQLVLQFLRDVDWGDSDLLIVDTPPGTSDEHLSLVNFMQRAGIDGAVVVTTPDELSLADVRREVQFCRRAGVRVIGVIENMSTFSCPRCGASSSIYPRTTGGADSLCSSEGLDLLGRIAVDPLLLSGCVGERYRVSDATRDAVAAICAAVLARMQ